MRDDERLAFAADAVAGSRADALEAVVHDSDLALTRFTKNAIHQNVAESITTLTIRAIVDGRIGTASTNARGPGAISATRDRAIAQARFAPTPQIPARLPRPAGYQPPPDAYDPATANAPPSFRAEAAGQVFSAAARHGTWAAGYVSTERRGIAVANTNGVRAAFSSTDAALNVKCIAPEASGFAEARSRRAAEIDPVEVAERAASKAASAGSPSSCDVGEWTVVLEPAALGELLTYLLGHFSALRVDEGSSFLAEGLGKRYAAENVTLLDDYAHPLHAGRPFDAEGTPTQRVALLEAGIGRNFVADTEWSARMRVPNTGHFAGEGSFADGPAVRFPVLLPGSRSREELIAATERGILVSRFWYIRTVDQRKAIVTGMTRDGTFLIERGKVTRGLRNLRFNASILDLLGRCEWSNELVRTGGYSYRIVVPAGRFERFPFTSVTAF